MWRWKLIRLAIKLLYGPAGRDLIRLKKLRDGASREADRVDECWSTISTWAKTVDSLPHPPLKNESKIAVVMQGPILPGDDFTRETLKLYQRTFANCQLILSTWEDENLALLNEIERLGVTVVTGPIPGNPGPYNVNCQIDSTLRGLMVAKQSGIRHVLKTRTDMRMTVPNIPDFLVGLLRSFRLQEHLPQRERIIALDLSTRLYAPHHLSDIMMFGCTEDLLEYWSTPLVEMISDDAPRKLFGQFVNSFVPEVYLCESYLHRIGYQRQRSIASWWQSLRELFLVIDRPTLGLFWPKYDYTTNQRYGYDDELRNLALCTFRDWLNVQAFEKACPFDVDFLSSARLNDLIHCEESSPPQETGGLPSNLSNNSPIIIPRRRKSA